MSEELDERVIAAAKTYRSAEAVPRDQIWARIEHGLHAAGDNASSTASWTVRGTGSSWRYVAAAVLLLACGAVIGIAGERMLRGMSASSVAADAVRENQSPSVASYLASSDSLLKVFTIASHGGRVRGDLEPWARELISRTRVLEQTTPAADTTLRRLLGDLDLVLVQIAQYAGLPAADASEAMLIDDAIVARKLNDNLRLMVRRAAN